MSLTRERATVGEMREALRALDSIGATPLETEFAKFRRDIDGTILQEVFWPDADPGTDDEDVIGPGAPVDWQ